uniref:Uncharacterized protein n=1 Tax=Ditylenchus dipsaci TaxID=166011 RepID=A0A915D020_9BILA
MIPRWEYPDGGTQVELLTWRENVVMIEVPMLELNNLNEYELDHALCLEIRSRALALQIQWIVVDVNNRFLLEHQLSPASIPILLSTLHCHPSRKLLKESLSDLFYFLRFPMLPSRFRESLNGWITELGSVLLKACTTDDQMFLLCQVLRSPSPLKPWAIPLIQTFITSPSLNMDTAMHSFVALMSILMNTINSREQFLTRITKFYAGDDSWNVVDDEGDLNSTHMFDLTETDLIQLLAQFLFVHYFLFASNISLLFIRVTVSKCCFPLSPSH